MLTAVSSLLELIVRGILLDCGDSLLSVGFGTPAEGVVHAVVKDGPGPQTVGNMGDKPIHISFGNVLVLLVGSHQVLPKRNTTENKAATVEVDRKLKTVVSNIQRS